MFLLGALGPFAPLRELFALYHSFGQGSEGAGVADVLFGDYPFSGTLPVSWPHSVDQLPLPALLADPAGPLFPRGFGLTTE